MFSLNAILADPWIGCQSIAIPDGGALPDAARMGVWLADLHASFTGAVRLRALATRLSGLLGLPESSPLARACGLAADAVSAWRGHDYHSDGHHAEVAVNVVVLAAISAAAGEPVAREDAAVLLLAALTHDLLYMPGAAAPFTRERTAADAADAIASRAGAGGGARALLRWLVLATEPSARPLLAAAARGEAASLPGEIARLPAHPDPVRLATVLSDADLLSSAGLTLEWHREQASRLARERGAPVDAGGERAFFEHVVGHEFASAAGRHFAANLACIRAAVDAEALSAAPAQRPACSPA